MKTGDTVRYLNAIGGGVVTRIDGKIAYVEEDGFETPVLVSELVVVLPAGHKADAKGPHLMFDQAAFDAGKREDKKKHSPVNVALTPDASEEPQEPIEETPHGDKLNLVLAFEPADRRRLSDTTFAAILVNDSNYFLQFAVSGRPKDSRADEWHTIYIGVVAPNELIDLAEFSHADLIGIERIAVQAIAYKKKDFALKTPVNVERRLDLTKFHKLHCFREGLYFDTPVLEFPLIKDDASTAKEENLSQKLAAKYRETPSQLLPKNGKAASSKYGSDASKRYKEKAPATNPHKLLPPIEIDLHMSALTDTLAGMQPKDMLEMQLDTVRRTMKEHRRRIGQKIIFIHGKGEGVLRQEVLKLLRREYPTADLQDASFREYGFGATLVTIRQA